MLKINTNTNTEGHFPLGVIFRAGGILRMQIISTWRNNADSILFYATTKSKTNQFIHENG